MSVPASSLHRLSQAGCLLAALSCAAISAAAENAATAPSATAQPMPETTQAAVPDSLPGFELQVLAASVVARESADTAAPALAEIHRGQLLKSDLRRGDWFRVPLDISPSGYGWIRLESAEYGDMTLAVQDITLTAALPVTVDPAVTENVQRSSVDGRRLVAVAPIVRDDQIAAPAAMLPRESVPISDRWRIMQALDFKFPFVDPYHQNVLKGDLPVAPELAPEWFFNLGLISDTTYEMRRLPTPVAPQTSGQPGSVDIFGGRDQSTLVQNVILSLGLIKGNTTFRPPDYEFRFVPVFNYNRSRVEEERVLRVDPRTGVSRTDNFVAVQELFFDMHLRNVSERYDFDSLRLGIQPFSADFRGFLFQDNALGIRLFGTRDNNHWQYNAGWLRRLEKDTNSGLNDLSQRPRDDDLYFFNLYRQDFPVVGFTSQLALIHNRNNEDEPDYYDTNGNLVRPAVLGDVRPHDYQVTYLGYNGDGHFGRYGLSASTYLALGQDERSPLAQAEQSIEAWFLATELSRDFDWIRLRGNFLYASGDSDPYDDKSTGFDAILENPQFAGADTSFFIRQAVPLIGGGGVALSGRNGLLPSLRSSKDQGQSNFVNPGLTLLGIGADFDLLPTLRLLSNVSLLRFNDTEVLGVLRNQLPPSKELGTDISAGIQFRPLYSQNIVITGSVAALIPGKGLRQLYEESDSIPQYSALFNVLLAF